MKLKLSQLLDHVTYTNLGINGFKRAGFRLSIVKNYLFVTFLWEFILRPTKVQSNQLLNRPVDQLDHRAPYQERRDTFDYAKSQFGISVTTSDEGDVLVGAAGTQAWSGSIVSGELGDRTFAEVGFQVFWFTKRKVSTLFSHDCPLSKVSSLIGWKPLWVTTLRWSWGWKKISTTLVRKIISRSWFLRRLCHRNVFKNFIRALLLAWRHLKSDWSTSQNLIMRQIENDS